MRAPGGVAYELSDRQGAIRIGVTVTICGPAGLSTTYPGSRTRTGAEAGSVAQRSSEALRLDQGLAVRIAPVGWVATS